MNQIQPKINNVVTGNIDFNQKEVEKHLKVVLQKYQGIIVTPETVADCKKTRADLNKIKGEIEDFRKDGKKQLSAPIDAFEKKCKALASLVTEVKVPLEEQINAFEDKKKQEKLVFARKTKQALIDEYGFTDKQAEEIIIESKYGNLSATKKSVEDDLRMQAEVLKEKIQAEKKRKNDLIKILESKNAHYDNKLPIEFLDNMMELDTADIVIKIDQQLELLNRKQEVEQSEPPEGQKQAHRATKNNSEGHRVAKVNLTLTGEYRALRLIMDFIDSNGVAKDIESKEWV